MGKKAKRDAARLAAGELEMLHMLWREGGVTILEAQQALGLPIGYTTVQTRLNRLVRKGLVQKSRTRPAKYTAAVTAEQVSADDLDLLVERVAAGEVVPLVAQLVNRRALSAGEITQLKRLVSEAELRARPKKGRRTNRGADGKASR